MAELDYAKEQSGPEPLLCDVCGDEIRVTSDMSEYNTGWLKRLQPDGEWDFDPNGECWQLCSLCTQKVLSFLHAISGGR